MTGPVLDNGERVEADASLRRSEARLREAERMARLGNFGYDADGCLTWSDGMCEVFGIEPDDAPRTFEGFLDFVHPADRPLLMGKAADQSWHESDFTFRIVGPGGVVRHIRSRTFRGSGQDGGQSFGINQDVTEQVEAEERLRYSEALARGVIEASPDAFLRLDDAGTIMEWNEKAEALFGWKRAEAIGQFMPALLLPDSEREPFVDLLQSYAMVRSGQPLQRRARLTMLDAQNQDIPVEITIVVLRYGNDLVVNGLVRDLREELATEAKLHQAQRMETVGHLAGGIAHDFNNLLAIIIAHLDMAADAPELSDDTRELLTAARDAGLRGVDLTSRLLTFARRQALQPQPTHLEGLITGFARLLDRGLRGDIKLDLDLAPDLWPVHVDPGQLKTALTNLTANARDAMPTGGTLRIVACNVTPDPAHMMAPDGIAPDAYVRLDVADTGTGMSPETLARAVEPFFTTKKGARGAGLGLSMVDGFALQSGGQLVLRSGPGQGTTASLYLPRAVMAEAPDPDAAPPVVSGTRSSEVILLVDDNEMLRRMTARQLRGLGYHVVEAGDGPEALARLAKLCRLDLLLSDVVMPGGINGADLARSVCQQRPGTPVLLISGFTEDALTAGHDGVSAWPLMRKPFRLAELETRIRREIDAARHRSPGGGPL